jgi:hypothetical protein
LEDFFDHNGFSTNEAGEIFPYHSNFTRRGEEFIGICCFFDVTLQNATRMPYHSLAD